MQYVTTGTGTNHQPNVWAGRFPTALGTNTHDHWDGYFRPLRTMGQAILKGDLTADMAGVLLASDAMRRQMLDQDSDKAEFMLKHAHFVLSQYASRRKVANDVESFQFERLVKSDALYRATHNPRISNAELGALVRAQTPGE